MLPEKDVSSVVVGTVRSRGSRADMVTWREDVVRVGRVTRMLQVVWRVAIMSPTSRACREFGERYNHRTNGQHYAADRRPTSRGKLSRGVANILVTCYEDVSRKLRGI